MEFRVDKGSEFPIYQQLKEQVKYFLLSGGLQPGDRLPPPKDLAGYLRINRNTVIVAYKELEKEGLIVTRHGQGTYLADELPPLPDGDRRRELVALAQETVARAEALGFSARDLFTVVYGQAVLRLEGEPAGKILFIECNTPDLDYYAAELTKELGISVAGCLLAELPDQMDSAQVREADLLVTTFFHVEDVKALADAAGKEVFAIIASPELHVFLQIGRLAAGTRVGLVCAEKWGAKLMRGSFEAAGVGHVAFDHAGFNDHGRFQALLDWADVIVSSRVVLDEVRAAAPARVTVLEYAKTLEKVGIRLLREYLTERRNKPVQP